MARPRRRARRERPTATDELGTAGSDDFVGQLGLFETGNGSPFGPVEIALAIVAAVLIYPITRLIGRLRRR
jgi:hypothetical protein